jgi:hypothetical protein
MDSCRVKETVESSQQPTGHGEAYPGATPDQEGYGGNARGRKVGTGTVRRIKREMERIGPFDSVSTAA